MSSNVVFKTEEFPPLGLDAQDQRAPEQAPPQANTFINSPCSNGARLEDTFCDRVDRLNIRNVSKSNLVRQPKRYHKIRPSAANNSPCKSLLNQDIDCRSIKSGEHFIRNRVGVLVNNYSQNIESLLKTHYIGRSAEFVVTPIEPVTTFHSQGKFMPIPDVVAPHYVLSSSVALDLGDANLDIYNGESARHFTDLLDHAFYLPSKVILVNTPSSKTGCLAVASLVNESLAKFPSRQTLILFKVPLIRKSRSSVSDLSTSPKRRPSNSLESSWESAGSNGFINSDGSSQSNSSDSQEPQETTEHGWSLWHNIRSHLPPDIRVGVCLTLDDPAPEDCEELERWTGEPVRMIVMSTNQFTPTTNGVRMLATCKRFIRKVAKFNSLKTSFVIEACGKQDIKPYLDQTLYIARCLKDATEASDDLIGYHDILLDPLQPLANNLDAETYATFEADSMKYIVYRDAMVEALHHLIVDKKSMDKRTILMVLGAGRGPLVDKFIEAIQSVASPTPFKIYALDKNKSSVRSLQHYKETKWSAHANLEIEVVEADMRDWQPKDKADIIVTELLGSFGDNELSPECIDGLWHFATPQTICIPQYYSSYLAPISSLRLHQKLQEKSPEGRYDKIYVVNLVNCYYIDETQELFKFNHQDISKKPVKFQNERYKELSFISKVDTVCHGFAGFFSAKLFGTCNLSTKLNGKTPTMNSWFAAYIPLQNPINLSKNTRLTVHFWRRETETKVWYQWAVTEPVCSRVYSSLAMANDLTGAVMPKFTS